MGKIILNRGIERRIAHQQVFRSVIGRELFIRVPLFWLGVIPPRAAAGTLRTALAIWFRAGCSKRDELALRREDLDRFELSRWAYYRGLADLEFLRLIKVQRRKGARAVIRILRPEVGADSTRSRFALPGVTTRLSTLPSSNHRPRPWNC